MTDRELMQMAMDALETITSKVEPMSYYCSFAVEIESLRAALAQPKQEPVAWFMEGTFEDGTPSFTQVCETDPEFYVPLYTAPPQREWQGLTEYEVGFLTVFDGLHDVEVPLLANFIRHIEAKLKEKNA